MPDDPDADVGPASDREGLFGRAPSPGSGGEAAAPDADRSGASARGSFRDDPTVPLFPPATPLGAAAAAPRSASGSPTDAGGQAGSVPARPAERGRGSVMSFFRELPVLLLVAFLLAFLLRTFVLQVFYIPSGSMQPTLEIDDRMVVEKLTYLFRDPVRGEIVVFEGETLGTIDADATAAERVVRGMGQFLGLVPASARDFVKRVIGMPGDEIEIVDGEVFVNGQALTEPYVRFEDPSDYGPVTVPADSLFFLGDNRPNSSDSRRGLGFVPLDAVVGRSVVIIWPFGEARSLTGLEHEVPAPSSRPSGSPSPDAGIDDAAAAVAVHAAD